MSLTNRTTLHYEVDDVFDLIVLSNDKNVQRNFDDVTKRASFIYRLPYPLDLARGWQVALVKMTIPVTDNCQVQDAAHSNLGLGGKSNKILACIRNPLNNKIVAEISWDRNKSYHNFFQLAQDILLRLALNNRLLFIHNEPPVDNRNIPTVSCFQFAQYVESNGQYKYSVVLDFEPYLHELLNQPIRELFERLKTKHSLATKSGWITNINTDRSSSVPSVDTFTVQDRHYGMDFVSQLADQKYDGIVFTNRYKNARWDVINLEIGIGLAKLLQMESEEIYNTYWSAPDWQFEEVTATKVSIMVKNPKTFNSKAIKYNIVEPTDSVVQQPYLGMLRRKNNHTIVVNLPTDYTLELKQPHFEAFTPLLQQNGEIDFNDTKHAEKFETFLTRTPKIYSVHLSLLKAKSFLNEREESQLYTFTLSGKQNETIIAEPSILRYKQLTSDSQHTHLRVDIKNPEGLYPSLYTGALSLQLRVKAFEDEWFNDA